jgi:hypothetical protein
MRNKPENRSLGRVSYWEGQTLRSGDFLDIERVEAERRWWHNRAVHNTYGVYAGLVVTSGNSQAGKPVVLRVTPGLAYDCFGRELVLECLATLEAPVLAASRSGNFTLLIRYRKPGPRNISDAKSAVCCLSGGPFSGAAVEFAWTSETRIPPEAGVPLGSCYYKGGRPERFISVRPAPRHRPLARPRLGTGSTVPGNTAWQPWDFIVPGFEGPPSVTEIGVQTTIDTSAAGFTQLPQYFAWLEGSVWNSQAMKLVPALLPGITNESITGFTFRLILMQVSAPAGVLEAAFFGPRFNLVQTSNDFATFAMQQKLSVVWLGCQMPAQASVISRTQITCTKKFHAEMLHGPDLARCEEAP